MTDYGTFTGKYSSSVRLFEQMVMRPTRSSKLYFQFSWFGSVPIDQAADWTNTYFQENDVVSDLRSSGILRLIGTSSSRPSLNPLVINRRVRSQRLVGQPVSLNRKSNGTDRSPLTVMIETQPRTGLTRPTMAPRDLKVTRA
jgi:hypothetical protein